MSSVEGIVIINLEVRRCTVQVRYGVSGTLSGLYVLSRKTKHVRVSTTLNS